MSRNQRAGRAPAPRSRPRLAPRVWPWLPLPLALAAVPLVLGNLADGPDRSWARPAPGTPDEPTPPAATLAEAAGPPTPSPARAPVAATSTVREEPRTPRPAAAERAPDVPDARALLDVRVEDAGGRPVPFAALELRHVAPDGDETLHGELADELGTLRLQLPPGKAIVTAWSIDATAGPRAVELRARARERLALALEPAREVTGVVVDARDGRPVVGASVSFWTFSESDRVETGADGTFRHPRFPGSDLAHQVRVEAPGYGGTVRYLELPEEGGWLLAAATADGRDERGDGTPWLRLALVPELVLTGRVVDDAGRPLAGARVRAEGYVQFLPSVASRDGAEGLSDEHGEFALGGLRSDVGHALAVSAPGLATRVVELEGGEGTHVDVGRLALARDVAVGGVVLAPDGEPVADIEVELVLREEARGERALRHGPLDVPVRTEGRVRRTRTGADGTFLFEGLVPARYALVATRDRGALVEETVEAPGARVSSGLVLRLPAETLTLVGEVRDADGPVPNAEVLVERFGPVARVRADAEGRFRVAGLDDRAAYDLLASAPCPRTGAPRTCRSNAWGFERARLRLGGE